jgi:hypothetical protein
MSRETVACVTSQPSALSALLDDRLDKSLPLALAHGRALGHTLRFSSDQDRLTCTRPGDHPS